MHSSWCQQYARPTTRASPAHPRPRRRTARLGARTCEGGSGLDVLFEAVTVVVTDTIRHQPRASTTPMPRGCSGSKDFPLKEQNPSPSAGRCHCCERLHFHPGGEGRGRLKTTGQHVRTFCVSPLNPWLLKGAKTKTRCMRSCKRSNRPSCTQ